MRRQLDSFGVPYDIADAVDGNDDLSPFDAQLQNLGDCEKRLGVKFDAGSVGCYLSHYRLWEKIANDNIPAAVILEDDAQLGKDFMQAAAAAAHCKWEWDVILLHADGRRGGGMRVLSSLDDGRELVQYQRHHYATAAYLVSLSGAKKLRDYCRRLRLPIDSMWKPWWEWGRPFYAVRPHVATITGADSVIEKVAAETGDYKDGKFQSAPTNWQLQVYRSLMRKRDRFAAWLYFHSRRPQKKNL